MKPETIYCGNAKMVMSRFPEESVDLIYMDPPFFSNRNYELVWGNGYELSMDGPRHQGVSQGPQADRLSLSSL